MDLVFILLGGSQLALAVALFYCQCCQLATSGRPVTGGQRQTQGRVSGLFVARPPVWM